MVNLPLRLESPLERWWFVAPIDWAAANGHTEVVKELLRMDPSLLHHLTSKKRMRRLEKLWDDQDAFSDAAIGRSKIVKDLLKDYSEDQEDHADHKHEQGSNRMSHKHSEPGLFKAGYGVWMLYIAASAGDEGLVNQMITANPELVKGDGDFGLSDLLYAAARGPNVHIFQQILTLAKRMKASYISGKPKGSIDRKADDLGKISFNDIDYIGLSYNSRTIQSKALLATARAGNVDMVRELLKDSSTHATVLSFRDSNGTTALHAAAGRGHLEVVKLILEMCPSSVQGQDGKGNTALHTAGRRGCLKVAMELMMFDKELIYMRNRNGETPLHSAVLGSKQAPPKLIMKQGGRIEVVRQLLACNGNRMPDYVNWKTTEGCAPLHLSVISARIDESIVDLLLQSPGICVLETNNQGFTALDLARSCRDAHPAAEFRCNIVISLLTAAVAAVAASAKAGHLSRGPDSAGISVDLANPLMCSFSHDIVIPSDGESHSGEGQNVRGRSEPVDGAIDVQSGGGGGGDIGVASANPRTAITSGQPVGMNVLPDEDTLSRNLAYIRQTSAGIFEPQGTPGIPSPVQCFSTLNSLFCGHSILRRPTAPDQVVAHMLWSKRWNKFRQCMLVRAAESSPQSLREKFSSTDSASFHPEARTETAVDCMQDTARSISVSPFASPTGSMDQSPTLSSPSYIKSWLKAMVLQSQSPSSSKTSSPRKPSRRQMIKKRIKQITASTHLSFGSASEIQSLHEEQLNHVELHEGEQASKENLGVEVTNNDALITDGSMLHLENQLSMGRQNSVHSCIDCHPQCFCPDNLFQSNQHHIVPCIKEGQMGPGIIVHTEAPLSLAGPSFVSAVTDVAAKSLTATEMTRSDVLHEMADTLKSTSEAAHDDDAHVSNATLTRSNGSSPGGSPRPSASLSLSLWLSPTLQAARRRDLEAQATIFSCSAAANDQADINDMDSDPRTSLQSTAATPPIPDPSSSRVSGDSLSHIGIHVETTAAPPFSPHLNEPPTTAAPSLSPHPDEPSHQRTISEPKDCTNHRQDSFRLCLCGPCFQDGGALGDPESDSEERERERSRVYHV